MGLFSKKQPTVAPPPAPTPAPMPTENDAVRARENATRRISKLQGARSTILTGVLGDAASLPKTSTTLLGSQAQ